ncbi:hypothetical protein GRS48_14030 [Halorubrum sp. JWXQ-INN 858]|uniref:hypothetical protein n=1 Tax=Halorubrum sp. JWXQ-INN 858 TaxID=2690782 RepID=UPI00135BED9F|nr:hypothetical protein [Halorubrum sp. JWXQ-INN 858]MWV65929.1 hypothetical protein [Halorubrum sp. JWXQ-INN 858]
MLEFVESVDTLDSHRDLLKFMIGEGDWYRLALRNDVEGDEIAEVSAAGLIEHRTFASDEATDWRPTGRAEYLLDSIPEDGELDGTEVGALFAIGDRLWEIPDSEQEWAERELKVEISDRSLRVLHATGLVQRLRDESEDDLPERWMATRRLSELQDLLWGFAQA